eukprot:scpid75211/ scgid13432/ 
MAGLRHLSAIILVLHTVVLLAKSDTYEVVKTGPCTADIKYHGVLQHKIDLHPLNSDNPAKPTFSIPGGGYTFLYNPCTGMNTPCSGGSETVCQIDGNSHYPAGRTNFSTFTFLELGKIQLEYDEDPADGKARRSFFTLMCSKTATEPNITYVEEKPGGHYRFNFQWKTFCGEIPDSAPGGLSGGSYMLIIVLPAVALYFVVGIVVQKFVLKGDNMLPNSGLWTSLPGLVKDGFFLIVPCSGGASKPGYDSIGKS